MNFPNPWQHYYYYIPYRLLLFAMIRSILKSFKVPDVEVVVAQMSNESALTCMTDSKKLGQTGPGWMG